MKGPGFLTVTRSARAVRLRAATPRILLAILVLVFCVRGVRATFDPTPVPVATAAPRAVSPDLAARALAERFTRAYLTWEGDQLEQREQRLDAIVGQPLDGGAGLSPAPGTSQDVTWTSVVAERRSSSGTIVTVAAQAGDRLLYVAVPVSRTPAGALAITRMPALVGPPAIDTSASAPSDGDEVEDPDLAAVAQRSLTNYLARARENLLADLAPAAVVSVPSEPLTLRAIERMTWLVRDRRLAVELQAEDADGGIWTLRYEIDVEFRDRWYLRSIEPPEHRDAGDAP